MLVLSSLIILIGLKTSTTGGFIGTFLGISWLFFIGLFAFMVSIIVIIHKKTLDMIVIPTGGYEENEKRTKKALEEYDKGNVSKFLISGIDEGIDLSKSQKYQIYKLIRDHDYKAPIKASDIKLTKGRRDSLDNIIYLIPELEGKKDVGIVSYPEHLKRFKYIIQKAKDEGKIPKGIKFHYIPTSQNLKEFAYGFIANQRERIRLRKGIDEAMKEERGNYLINLIKRFFS